jgi:hypothetical protein
MSAASCSNCNRLVYEGVVCGDCDGTQELQSAIDAANRKLAAFLPVVEAAKAWRIGRDRNVVGTAPSGGQRSATGVALIDALDALATPEKGGADE